MANFDNHKDALDCLRKAQDVEQDNREKVREAHNFLEKRDGQWEPSVIERMRGRPRYTLDKCNPVVDSIAGEMDQADFDIRVRPAGGDATKELAMTYDGMIRNIENMSNASRVYAASGREMVAGGLGGWEIVQDWVDGDSFDQDLLIKRIPNFEDRVWLDPNAVEQDASDAMWGVLLTQMGTDEYEKKFPEGSKVSVGQDRCNEVYYQKKESVTVGRIMYKKAHTVELVLFSDGSVREANDELDSVMDELAEQGITEIRRRERKSWKVYSRMFDGQDWLTAEEETVFSWIPIIPTYGNFAIREGKVIYRGAIEKLFDAQRIYNYSKSREVEDVAFSPKRKIWMTRKQAQGNEAKLAKLNTSPDPVSIYTSDPEAQPPTEQGGAQIQPGVLQVSQGALGDIQTSAGIDGIQRGDIGDSALSGVAIQSLQNKGDTSTIKYFKSQEVAICHTGRILVDAIPKVYDSQRVVRILNEDGSFEMASLHDRVWDNESGKFVTVNDLSKGKYDVTCDVGPAFKNRQQESVKAIQELIQVVPGLGEISADILLGNIASPGVDMAAERVRQRLVQSGVVPESQLTDEEKERIQQQLIAAQQQPPEPDPQAEFVQAQTMDVMSKAQERQDKSQLAMMKMQLEVQKMMLNAQNEAEKRDLDEAAQIIQQQQLAMQQQNQMFSQMMEQQQWLVQELATQAETWKTLREASGADAIVGPGTVATYAEQGEIVRDTQSDQ